MRWYVLFIEHNSGEAIYRSPFGACETDSKITLRLFAENTPCYKDVFCIVGDREIPMQFAYSTGNGCMFECTFSAPEEPQLLFYYFRIESPCETLYYGNNSLHLGGLGQSCSSVPESRYQITVFDKDFTTPDWVKNSVIYQIFPDRFYRGKETPFHGIKRNWGEEPFYRADQFGGEYLSNDFFGGNLDGIREKLPYLKDLGITAIYLNPIGKAFSNHRYDTGDYEIPDETLGTAEDFEKLSKEAKKLGIRIILDGVFSHTGADSKYFNKYGNYDSIGACQSEKSPYFSWYNFKHFPDKYESWWGFDTLPNVNELDKSFTEYIAENKDSVIRKWLKRGASGLRLDVADELPDKFIKILRSSLKDENADSYLVGEVWEDASNKVSYGEKREFLLGYELDSVMNYVFREAVLSYLTSGDAKLFSMRLHSLMENYPIHSLYTAMNLISSHDVPRALTVLSDSPDFRTISRNAQHDYVIPEDKKALAKRRMVLAIALQMTLPGAPSVYYGDEKEMFGYADPFNRAPMDWEKDESEIFRQTKLFANLRGRIDTLRTGFYTLLYAENGVISYMRYTDGGRDAFGKECEGKDIIVIVNSHDEWRHIALALGEAGVSKTVDILSGEIISQGGTISLDLAPLSYRIFSTRKDSI